MTNEKLLNALISRLASREMTAFGFITIASSASLVLLGFFDTNKEQSIWIPLFGILFPVLALTWNEVTRLTLHKHDQNWIRKIIKEDKETTYDSEEILRYTKSRFVRMLLARIMLLIPVIGWIIVFPLEGSKNFEYCIKIGGFIVVIVTTILLSLINRDIKRVD